MPIFKGFTEIYLIETVCHKNRITFSSRDIQNTHLERYLRIALKMGLTKCKFITDTQIQRARYAKETFYIHKSEILDLFQCMFLNKF